MNILFTGATGVIGRRAVPLLLNAGHDVRAVARSDDDRDWLGRIGAQPIIVDLFDPVEVAAAVDGSDVVIHMATSIPPLDEMSKRSAWAMNDRLRSTATANLVDAALAYGVEAFVQQSITFVYADGSDRWLNEDSAVEPWWDVLDSALVAERHVARFAGDGGRGVILRFSNLYGPGPVSGEYVAAVADRKLPILGAGTNYVSHLHIDDAATAIVAALGVPSGTFNVSDDMPVTKQAELEALATALGAKSPRRLPPWLVRTVAGKATRLLTVSQRVSNHRFKSATAWMPQVASVIDGWTEIVGSDRPRRDLRG